MLDRYVEAFWNKDIEAIVSMLTKDAVWEMPPYTGWYQGAENIGRLVDSQCPGGVHDMRMLPTRANGQPAFGLYMRGADGTFTPFHLQVLTIGPRRRRARRRVLRGVAVREVRPARVAAGRLRPRVHVVGLDVHAPEVGSPAGPRRRRTARARRRLHARLAAAGRRHAAGRPDSLRALGPARTAAPHGRLAGGVHRRRRHRVRRPGARRRRRTASRGWSTGLRLRACALLAAWAHHPGSGDVSVSDRELRSDLLAAAGSLEIAVHGWDVAQACGVDRPLPAALALELLDVVPLFIGDADRPGPVRRARRRTHPLAAEHPAAGRARPSRVAGVSRSRSRPARSRPSDPAAAASGTSCRVRAGRQAAAPAGRSAASGCGRRC